MGDGMIDASYGAIGRATGVDAKLVSFNVSAVTGGSDALGDVVVQLDVDGRLVTGRGVAADVVEASARAYLAAVNRALRVVGPGGPDARRRYHGEGADARAGQAIATSASPDRPGSAALTGTAGSAATSLPSGASAAIGATRTRSDRPGPRRPGHERADDHREDPRAGRGAGVGDAG